MKTHKVRLRRSNAGGLHDMSGNVYEWVWDWEGSYPSGTVSDPIGPSGGAYRLLRGGGWYGLPRECRCAFRYSLSPDSRDDGLGFRLARTVP